MSFRGLRWVQAGMVCMALALTGCMSPDEDDTPNEVTTLSGTVTGTVLDSNGSPIEGVVVRYTGAVVKAAVSAVTNDAGQFELPGVVVSGTSGIGANDANGPITLVLDTGELEMPHMGATVRVSPDADVIANPGDAPVFINNFNVDTGPVRLPALNTEVRGTVRNAETGAAVSGVQVTLEFQGVEFDQDGRPVQLHRRLCRFVCARRCRRARDRDHIGFSAELHRTGRRADRRVVDLLCHHQRWWGHGSRHCHRRSLSER